MNTLGKILQSSMNVLEFKREFGNTNHTIISHNKLLANFSESKVALINIDRHQEGTRYMVAPTTCKLTAIEIAHVLDMFHLPFNISDQGYGVFHSSTVAGWPTEILDDMILVYTQNTALKRDVTRYAMLVSGKDIIQATEVKKTSKNTLLWTFNK